MLKVDITTFECLMQRITSAPIVPKPICRSLDFIYDWKTFICNKLTTPGLKYHSKYNSFLLSIEHGNGENDKRIVFRGKRLPQDSEMVPRAGIRIINEGVEFEPVGPAEYRENTIKFDEIMKGSFLRKRWMFLNNSSLRGNRSDRLLFSRSRTRRKIRLSAEQPSVSLYIARIQLKQEIGNLNKPHWEFDNSLLGCLLLFLKLCNRIKNVKLHLIFIFPHVVNQTQLELKAKA